MFEVGLALCRAEGELLGDVPVDVRVHCLNARRLWRAWWPLARLLRSEAPDIVFSTASGMNSVALLARLLARRECRVILSERNVLFHGGRTLKRRLGVLAKRLLYSKADCITAVSGGVKDDLVRTLSLAPARISVVLNPVVTAELRAGMAEEVDHPWFHERVPVILGAGRLVPEKDFATLIHAFGRVRAGREARLVILGEGELRSQLTECIRSLGLGNEVWLPGFERNPFKYMARSSVFVLSSRQEGLPGVLIQAMACGMAVVSTDCPAGPGEIITDGVDGWLVPVGDVGALANRLQLYLDDRETKERMAANARRSAQRYAAEAILTNYTTALLGSLGS